MIKKIKIIRKIRRRRIIKRIPNPKRKEERPVIGDRTSNKQIKTPEDRNQYV